MTVLLILGLVSSTSGAGQPPFDLHDLAHYQLTRQTFTRFQRAARLVGEASRRDPALAQAPLFTREVAISGDVLVAAAELEARLRNHPQLAAALRSARITPRVFTKFALALLAAHLAHGFVAAGVLQRVPDGAATRNVAFVAQYLEEVGAVLKELGVEGPVPKSPPS